MRVLCAELLCARLCMGSLCLHLRVGLCVSTTNLPDTHRPLPRKVLLASMIWCAGA